MRRVALTLTAFTLAACATNVGTYIPPSVSTPAANTITINEARDQVWNRLVPALSRQFFVINTIDRASGLINISYAGDPERYVDCGIATITTTMSGREEVTRFPAARERVEYQVRAPAGVPLFISRRMTLEGRVNIVVEAVGPRQTRITASTRYVLSRDSATRFADGVVRPQSSSISFNSGGRDFFPALGNADAVECRATGALEAELINLGAR